MDTIQRRVTAAHSGEYAPRPIWPWLRVIAQAQQVPREAHLSPAIKAPGTPRDGEQAGATSAGPTPVHFSSGEARKQPEKGVETDKVAVVKRKEKWYHGGLASAMAACFTHPFDLVKVQLQTASHSATGTAVPEVKMSIISLTKNIVQNQGFLALYNGISASLLRQLTYSTARFGIYQALKPRDPTEHVSFLAKCLYAGTAGGVGGFVGAPADLINVRMQNDSKVLVEQRRNYKHAVDGLVRVSREEGVTRLWRGSSMVVVRAVFMTIGQLSFYDQFKQMLLVTGWFSDTVPTHLLASSMAGAAATTITLPVDVLKTRMQNAAAGQYRNLLHCVQETAKAGPLGFFKGYIPAFVRIGPQTVLTFVFLEQLRQRFGITVV
ncbi:mitochondrial dicarboxylate carrier-like [Paramacrobiotus metropolitanus]|uniref:mitochondrial dicarboxylate carrier-like n=1 Tax=Paramacrobiotus metropolitanus TaxID=2943436 RepID=UPI002445B2C5|nr:mitochondrial dicarboxylate carrier-like [Paramacrobiotus metropolitanus]